MSEELLVQQQQEEEEETDNVSSIPLRKEEDVYDRQIRLWGAEAQARIAQSNVLYIHVTGLTSEVIKNLVLAGVRASICDNRPYPDAIIETPTFFLPSVQVSTSSSNENSNNKSSNTTDNDNNNNNNNNKRQKIENATSTATAYQYTTVAEAVQKPIEELNPLLGSCTIINSTVDDLSETDILQYDIIVASRITISQALRIVSILRTKKTMDGSSTETNESGKFFMADSFGFYGSCCIDLGPNHTYFDDVSSSTTTSSKKDTNATDTATPPPPTVKTVHPYIPLESMLNKTKLSDCTNRFHKTPPPVWVQYRTILQYIEEMTIKLKNNNKATITSSLGSWDDAYIECGDENDSTNNFITTCTKWLQETSPTLLIDNNSASTGSATTSASPPAAQVTTESLQLLGTVVTSEIAPVCAVLGGLISNEIIKAISKKGLPCNNSILFDGLLCKAWNFLIQPK